MMLAGLQTSGRVIYDIKIVILEVCLSPHLGERIFSVAIFFQK